MEEYVAGGKGRSQSCGRGRAGVEEEGHGIVGCKKQMGGAYLPTSHIVFGMFCVIPYFSTLSHLLCFSQPQLSDVLGYSFDESFRISSEVLHQWALL